jgi:hypothetical protein
MKKAMWLCVVFLLALPMAATAAGPYVGIPGATDKVKAATLIVPFFEVGIDSTQNGEDTFVMVTNTANSASKIHWHVWDIDGNVTDLEGNVDIVALGMWVTTMRPLIAAASATAKADLTQGNFYRGFVTIDLVSANTHDDPTIATYPFLDDNILEGAIYYVNLAKGMSNGIDMIPIEYVGGAVDNLLRDFYQNSDGREEIDSSARSCAAYKAYDGAGACPDDDYINRLDSRVYLTPPNGSSRIIVFTWEPGLKVGPSLYCDTHACEPELPYKQYNQAGTLISPVDQIIRLDHAVNVIDVTGTENGWVSIEDVPSGISNFQIFAFSLNFEASTNAALNWVAILESYITP